jgi:glycosyltransferase involved in cell wall biosynthesis
VSRLSICHLIDANADTTFFRLIARRHDPRYGVIIGSLAFAGALQRAMGELDTPTFTLGADRRGQYAPGLWRLVHLLREKAVTVLHAHCFDPTFLGLLAARLAGVRFVFTRHHSDHHLRLNKRWHTRVDAWCGAHADHVIAVSAATKRIMTDIEGVPADRISVVYNGMEPLTQPSTEDVDSLRRELGLTTERVVLVPARLHEEKGHRFLLDAISRIAARRGEKMAVLLAGEGAARETLEKEVQARALGPSVRFLGRRHDMPALILASDIVVVPSLAESFGIALLEAMSFGKAVVGTRTGGVPEVVADGETGFVVPPADAQSLAEALERLLGDPSLARRLGEAGRARATVFTAERMMAGYERVYERLLS